MTQVQNFQYRALSVAAGIDHSLILTVENKVFACGNGKDGNLGSGSLHSSPFPVKVQGGLESSKVTEIAAGRHSGAITEDGKLFVWGPVFIGHKPLNLPQELRSNSKMTSVSVSAVLSAVVDIDGHMYTWGIKNNYG